MLFRSHVPVAPLGAFIEDFWLYDDYEPRHATERILPSGTVELVVNLRDDEIRVHDRVRPGQCERFSGAVVSGTYARSFVIDTAEEASLVGVHFKPGGAFPFVGPPLGELMNLHVDLESLWGRAARELRERLLAATRPGERFRVLESTLLAMLARRSRRHAAVCFAVDALGRPGATVRDVVARAGLSHRRFVEAFEADVGLTPKMYSRIRRFLRAVGLMRRADAPDWSRLALDAGFFDQSHLIHDVGAFSGFTPAQLARHLLELQQRGVHLKRNHVPLAA